MRDLNALSADYRNSWLPQPTEPAEALFSRLAIPAKLEQAIYELRTLWVRHHLRVDGPDDPSAPNLAHFLANHADITTVSEAELSRCTKELAGRALADEILDSPPSLDVLEPVDHLLHFVSWEAFMGRFAGRAGTPEAATWAALLAMPADEATYLRNALVDERDGLRRASAKWRDTPRLLGRGPEHGHFFNSSYATRLAILERLDRTKWFSALRACPLRTELDFALRCGREHPNELLDLLRTAPIALDRSGNETGDVAAIALARRAWAYAADVAGVLDGRVRSAMNAAARERASEDAHAFRESEVKPWLDSVWASLNARQDSDELALALAVEQIAGRLHGHGRPAANEVARLTSEELENRVAAVWRPRIDSLPALLELGDLGRHYGPLERWLSYARIAVDDVDDVEAGSRLAWPRLVDVLLKFQGDEEAIRPPTSVSTYALGMVGGVLARQSDPEASFRDAFDRLWTEREQVAMGVRKAGSRSDLPIAAVASRLVLAGAGHAVCALSSLSDVGKVRGLWNAVLSALIECWLAFTDFSDESRFLAKLVYTCGGEGHREIVARDPLSSGLQDELNDALALVAPDSSLTIEIAGLWVRNGWCPNDVIAFFNRAGVDLDAISARMVADGSQWLRERDETARLRTVLGL